MSRLTAGQLRSGRMKVAILYAKDKTVVLDVPQSATVAQLKQAFYQELKKWAPSRQSFR